MRATAQAQPNIALVKYWGKRDDGRNLPASGSLSVTLDALWTRMTVDVLDRGGDDRLDVNGAPAPEMLPRVSQCLDRVLGSGRRAAHVSSDCNFPIGAGLASSASAFAALVVAAGSAYGVSASRLERARLAAAASGSAGRSLYGGIVLLRAGDDGIALEPLSAPAEWPLVITIAVTGTTPKMVGSTRAMTRSRQTSPFYNAWIERQAEDLSRGCRAVGQRDFAALAAVAEHNCLKMHAVMWTTRPPIVYWNGATIACLEAVRALQRDGVPVFFTIDAGPQVKAVSLPEAAAVVAAALERTDGVVDVLQSGLGGGARLLEPS